MDSVKVDVQEGSKTVASFVVNALTVRSNIRLMSMVGEIANADASEEEKGILMSCAALACTVADEDGELLYPESDGYNTVCDTMDKAYYDILCQAYNEMNPIKSGLKAKKKKS